MHRRSAFTRTALVWGGFGTALIGIGIDSASHYVDRGAGLSAFSSSIATVGHGSIILGLLIWTVGAAQNALHRRSSASMPPRVLAFMVAVLIGAASIAWAVDDQAIVHSAAMPQASVTHAVSSNGHSAGSSELYTLPSSELLAMHLLHVAAVDLSVTPDQSQAAQTFVESARAGSQRFQDPATAVASGYRPFLTGERVTYYYRTDYLQSERHLDPSLPDALVYLQSPASQVALVGAAFLAPAGQGPRLGGGLTIWWPHASLCLDAASVVTGVEPAPGGCPSGSAPLTPAPEILNTWFFDNPNGKFAMFLTREAVESAKPVVSTR